MSKGLTTMTKNKMYNKTMYNVLSNTTQYLLSRFIDILTCFVDLFNECTGNYRYDTTFSLFNKMLKRFVIIKSTLHLSIF